MIISYKKSIRSKFQGFTLIEMMVVVAIIGILAAIAYPSYDSFIRKSRRVDAKNALLDFAARQERYFSINNKYTQTPADLGYSAFPYAISSGSGSYYTLSVVATAQTYSATAAPTGNQLKDTNCYSFTINETGGRGNKNSSNAVIPGVDCW